MAKNPDFQTYYQSVLNKEDYQKFLDILKTPIKKCCRVNTLRISVEEFKKLAAQENIKLTPLPWSDEAFWYEFPRDRFAQFTLGKTDFYEQAYVYIQDAASILPVEALEPKPNEIILDLAAAPGGKTTFIAQKMQNTGLIIANEVVSSRAFTLQKMLAKYGVTNTAVTAYDASFFAKFYPNFFHKILLDAPCSGEGMRDQTSDFSYNKIKFNAKRQIRILKAAYQSLKPNGLIVYSTCALAIEENEAVIDHLLKTFPDAEIIPIKIKDAQALTHFQEEKFDDRLIGAVRLWPHLYNTNGFYVAKIKKTAPTPGQKADIKMPPPAIKAWQTMSRSEANEFVRQVKRQHDLDLDYSPKDYNLVKYRDQIWLQPRLLKQIKFMKLSYAGIKLAEILHASDYKLRLTEESKSLVNGKKNLNNANKFEN